MRSSNSIVDRVGLHNSAFEQFRNLRSFISKKHCLQILKSPVYIDQGLGNS